MRKLFITLCLLLFCLSADAKTTVVNIVRPLSAPAATNACDSSEGSIACEDAEGPRLTWNVTETGGTHSYAAHSGTLGCTDKGSYAVDILYPEADAADCYAYYDMSAGKYTMYVNFYVNFVASPNFANGDVQYIASASVTTNGDTPAWAFAFKEASAEQRQFTLFYNNSTAMTWVNCTMGTWYRISITYIKVNDSDDADSDDTIAWSLDGVEQQSITNANLTGSYVPRYLHISRRNEVANAESVHFQVDNIEVDATDMPAACP